MKKLVVLGAGESGTGAALLAKAKGYQVFVSDKNTIADSYRQQLLDCKVEFEEGKHTWNTIKIADEVIKSPGIPNNTPIIQALQKASIPILDEIEFASRYTNALLIAITGSNGKSTTTHLTHHLLKTSGLNVGIAGNMGASFARQVWLAHYDYYVLELSSFQLECLQSFKAYIACIINITPDHLDRYSNHLESYIAAKFNILRNMSKGDHFIYNQDDNNIQEYLVKQTSDLPQPYPISLSPLTQHGAYIQNRHLYFVGGNYNFQLPLQTIPLPGKHNMYNTMIAVSIANLLGISPTSIMDGLRTFKGLPHRMEYITSIKGVDFYNDSKATNVESAAVALESFENHPIIWIAGGYDKGNDYSLIKPIAKSSVKALICLGKDNKAICEAFKECNIPIYETQVMQEAVSLAYNLSKPQDIVLLSPACASFDLFKNFEDRGYQFRLAVQQLSTHIN
jgi:UDP-N-acetylmuramoylalanine--D-glutamate ligase